MLFQQLVYKICSQQACGKLVDKLLGNRKSNNISQLKIADVTTISDDKLLAETFNAFFVNIGTTLAS